MVGKGLVTTCYCLTEGQTSVEHSLFTLIAAVVYGNSVDPISVIFS